MSPHVRPFSASHAYLRLCMYVLGTYRYAPRGQVASTVTALFQGHPVVCARLVPSLLRLYVDVEVMDVRNNFYEKFMYRQYIGDLLAHLWQMPQHR